MEKSEETKVPGQHALVDKQFYRRSGCPAERDDESVRRHRHPRAHARHHHGPLGRVTHQRRVRTPVVGPVDEHRIGDR